jgi:hypothetical protein
MEEDRKTRTEVGIGRLAGAAGSEEAINRGRYIALGIVVFGMVGAVGAALRPLYRHHFRSNAKVARSAEAAQRAISFQQHGMSPVDAARLEQVKRRLSELQESFRARNPLLYEAQQLGGLGGSLRTNASSAPEPENLSKKMK